MRRFFKILFVLLILLLAAAVAVPFLVPADRIKSEVLAEIQARTGRKVGIGHLHFSLLPELSLDAEDVRIGNPAWAGGGDLARIKTLKLGLELFPLLHRQYRLKELVLDEPAIALVKRQGQTNWDFSRPGAKLVVSPETASQPVAQGGANALSQLHLGAVTVKNGTFSYRDMDAGKATALSELNVTLKAPLLSEKLELKGSAVFQGAKADLDITIGKPLAFQQHSPSNVQMKAQYGALDFTYDGSIVLAQNGVVGLSGKLHIPTLNTSSLSQNKAAPAGAGHTTPAPDSAARWSDAPIHLDALRRAEADLTVTIDTLTLPKTTLKDVTATIKLHNGALALQTGSIAAYGGTIRLGLTANAANAVGIAFSASKAQAEPLLHDFAGYDRLSGVIDLDTKLATAGASERAMIGALSGNGQIRFNDGKLKGVDLAGMLRRLGGAQNSENASTDFSELSASFTLARGIVNTGDIKLNSPLLRVTGSGQIDLPNWQENLLLKPMLVASIEGQGGKETPGIVVPVRVVGPLDHPHYQADLAATIQDNLETLKDPSKLKQSVKDLRKSLLQNNGAGLKGLLR